MSLWAFWLTGLRHSARIPGESARRVRHLNKGPYVVEAVKTLDDILHRMQAHHEKKTAMLRKLHVAAGFSSAKA
jgi:hypothetical protein